METDKDNTLAPTVPKPTCPYCETSPAFTSAMALMSHIQNVHPIPATVFKDMQ